MCAPVLQHPAVAGVVPLEVLELAVVERVHRAPSRPRCRPSPRTSARGTGCGTGACTSTRPSSSRTPATAPRPSGAWRGTCGRARSRSRATAGSTAACAIRGSVVKVAASGRRRREHRLPRHRRAAVGILGEDVVQDRRAGPREPDDEHRCDDPLVGDRGDPLPVVHVVQPVHRVEQRPLRRDELADRVQPRLGRERVEEPRRDRRRTARRRDRRDRRVRRCGGSPRRARPRRSSGGTRSVTGRVSQTDHHVLGRPRTNSAGRITTPLVRFPWSGPGLSTKPTGRAHARRPAAALRCVFIVNYDDEKAPRSRGPRNRRRPTAWPSTNDAPSEHSHSTAFATSSAVPMRPIGCRAAISTGSRSCSSITFSTIGVSTVPGHHVDPDATSAVVERRRLGETEHAVLRGHVGALARIAHKTRPRCRIDDRPASGKDVRDLVLQAQEHAAQHDADHTVPLLLREVGNVELLARDAGVVVSVVKSAERVDGPPPSPAPTRWSATSGCGRRDRRAALGLNARDSLVGRLLRSRRRPPPRRPHGRSRAPTPDRCRHRRR